MKAIIAGAALALILTEGAAAQGSHAVGGYYRNNGTYVAPHYQTNPDGNRFNNWSTQGNVNPYTGQAGTRSPYSTPSYGYTAPVYQAPRYSAPTYGYQPPKAPCYSYGC